MDNVRVCWLRLFWHNTVAKATAREIPIITAQDERRVRALSMLVLLFHHVGFL